MHVKGSAASAPSGMRPAWSRSCEAATSAHSRLKGDKRPLPCSCNASFPNPAYTHEMLQFSLATIILQLLVLAHLASATSPPNKVVLIEPPSQVEVNTTVCFGWVQPTDEPHYYGTRRLPK